LKSKEKKELRAKKLAEGLENNKGKEEKNKNEDSKELEQEAALN